MQHLWSPTFSIAGEEGGREGRGRKGEREIGEGRKREEGREGERGGGRQWGEK